MLNTNNDYRILKGICDELNLNQIKKSPTRVTATTKSLIDIVLVSDITFIKRSGVIKTLISDHYPVFVTPKLNKEKQPPQTITTRSFQNYNTDLFEAEISQYSAILSALLYTSPSVNDQLNSFNNIYETVLENHAPIKNIKIKSRPTPFVDDEIKLAMKERDQLHEQFSQTRCPLDWLNYKKARNTVKFKLRSSEKDYIANQISKCKKNSGALWKIIHQTLPKKECSKPVYSKDSTKVADDFNTYFATVGKNTAQAVKKLSEDNNIQPCPYLSNPAFRCPEAFKFVAVSEDEILRTIMSIPVNKSPGPDKINMRIIRDSLPYILTPVTNIINSSLLSSTYPDSWKLAEVVPIPKEGNHEIASNNRPISLLPILSKVCEKVALNQLTEYLNKYNLLSPCQSGNKRNHSTETININTTDRILKPMDQEKLAALILIDLSKAFDSIDHSILLRKLKAVGVSLSVLEWFYSFLTDRRQYVRIGSSTTNLLKITHGVPQGSTIAV